PHRGRRHRVLHRGPASRSGRDACLRQSRRHGGGDSGAVCVTAVREELELKARVEDPDNVRRALIDAGAELMYRGAMMDRRFDRRGRLEERDEVVRLRVYHPSDRSKEWGVLGWKGPVQQKGGYRAR